MIRPKSSGEDLANPAWIVESDDTFRAARWLGLVLIGLQALLLGYLAEAIVFPLVVVLLACGVGVTRYRLQLDGLVLQLLCTAMAIVFLLYYWVAPFPFPEESLSLFLRTPLAHTVARYLICLQLLALAVHHDSGRPPIWLAGVGAMCLPFAANIQVPDVRQAPLVLWMVTFVTVAALYCSHARRRVTTSFLPNYRARSLLLVTALLAATSLGGGTALAIFRYERNIEWFLRDYLGEGVGNVRTGFSPSGRLNDVMALKSLNSDRVALRVFSDREPGYLRGKAFENYDEPQWEQAWRAWSTGNSMQPLPVIPSVRGLPARRRGELVYGLEPAATGPWTSLEIWPDEKLGRYLFSTLDARYLSIESEFVRRDLHGNLLAEERDESLPYAVFTSQQPSNVDLDDELRTTLTALDPDLDQFVHDLAREIFAGCRTAREKMDRVQAWFRNNFSYQLGLRIPRGEDPLTYFLRHRKPAHCEFFATGTAVLLRSAGVPCRYINGYVVAEENEIGGFWVARNKDAHAWVEAYDDLSREWVIVESTPSVGVPSDRDSAVSSQLWDALQQRGGMLIATFRSIGLGGLLTRIVGGIWSVPGLILLLSVAAGILLWKSPSLPALQFRTRKSDRRLREFHSVLKRLDRQARRKGIERRSNETLLKFADRIRSSESQSIWCDELAACYEWYGRLRFQGQFDSQQLEKLRAAASSFHLD